MKKNTLYKAYPKDYAHHSGSYVVSIVVNVVNPTQA